MVFFPPYFAVNGNDDPNGGRHDRIPQSCRLCMVLMVRSRQYLNSKSSGLMRSGTYTTPLSMVFRFTGKNGAGSFPVTGSETPSRVTRYRHARWSAGVLGRTTRVTMYGYRPNVWNLMRRRYGCALVACQVETIPELVYRDPPLISSGFLHNLFQHLRNARVFPCHSSPLPAPICRMMVGPPARHTTLTYSRYGPQVFPSRHQPLSMMPNRNGAG
jgi:hypothetical protein